MPTLALDPAIDTVAPGHTRRRLWTAPAVTSHSLVALTLTKLYLAPPSLAVSQQLTDRIQNGGDIEAALGELATVIELPAIRRVRFDLVSNALSIEYVRPGRSDPQIGKSNLAQAVLTFANHEAADEVYTKVWRRLGDRFELRRREKTGWEAARFPLAVMAGVAFLTVAFGILGNAAADGPARTPFWKTVGSYDWRAICGFGGAILALLQMWLYRRLTQPPRRLELRFRPRHS